MISSLGLACRYTLGLEAAEQPKSLPTRISAALHSSRSEFSNNGTPLAIGRALRARRGSRGSPLAIGRALRARRGSRGLWLYVWCCSSARCHARDASRRETGPPRRYRRDAATRHATTQASRSTAPRTSARRRRRPCRTACPSRPKRAAATPLIVERACRCADRRPIPINQGPSSFFGGRRHVHASTP